MRRTLIVAAAVTALVAAAAGVALADPSSTPSLDTVVGVSCDPLHQQLAHDFAATKPAFPVACWESANPSTGAQNQTISAKALNSSDTSCQLTRPNGSDAGITALNLNQTDKNKDSAGQTIYCVDFVASSRAPNTTTRKDAFSVLARDGIAWSFPKVTGETNPQPASLTRAQLVAIYTCADRNWDQVGGKNAPIGVVLPQSGSGTRSSWLTMLGFPSTLLEPEPCWENGTVTVKGTSDLIEENTGLSAGNVQAFTKTNTIDGVSVPAADNIFPYSIGDDIAQGAATHGVGGHATSIWGHGNLNLGETTNVAGTPEMAITANASSQPVINPAWSSQFLRILYAVTHNGCFVITNPNSTAVCLPSTTPPKGGTKYPTYEVTGLAAFVGANGWICKNATAKADFVSYGFTTLSNCGALTAGD